MKKYKKGQYIAYILVGLLIILLTTGFFFRIKMIQKVNEAKTSKEINKNTNARTDSVYLVKKCIIEETTKALKLAASQGGVINISKFKNNGKYIYWIYWNDSINPNSTQAYKIKEENGFNKYSFFIENIPSLNYLKKELEPYLKERINKCLKGFKEVKEKYNVIINYEIKDVKVNFFNESVKVVADIPITIINLNNGNIDRNKKNFEEVIEIPYKRDYLKLKKLIEEIYSKGLYSYEYLILQSLDDGIPITISNFTCGKEGMLLNKTKIKEKIENILKYGKDLCYYNCKNTYYHPYKSLDYDLDVPFSNKEIINTRFLNIKYFDVYFNYQAKNSLDRYKDENGNVVEGENIKIRAKTPEEYFNTDEVLFKTNYYICEAHFFYDLIFNISLNYKDRQSKIPLSFNIMLDSGLLNNRPITLAFSKQYKGEEQPYVVKDGKYYLWPRKSKIVFFKSENNNFGLEVNNLEATLKSLVPTTKIINSSDIYLEFDSITNNELKKRIPIESAIFCFPFGIRIFKGNKTPLGTFCGDGNILVKNSNYSGLIDIKKLKETRFYKEIDGIKTINYLEVKNFNKNEFLKNLDKKTNLTLINVPINLDIVEIFNKEKFEEPNIWREVEYNKQNNKISSISLLSPTIYNPYVEKIINKNKTQKKVYLYTKKDLLYSKAFVSDYYYGSSFNYLNKTEAKLKIFDKQKILNKYFALLENNNITNLIIAGIYGNKVYFKKAKENGLIIEPISYKSFLIITNKDLFSLVTNLTVEANTRLLNFQGFFQPEKIDQELKEPLFSIIDNYKTNDKLKQKIKEEVNSIIEKIKVKSCFSIFDYELCNGMEFTNNFKMFNQKMNELIENYSIVLVGRYKHYNQKTTPSINDTIKEFKSVNFNSNNELELDKNKFNELISNALYFSRQRILKEKLEPFFGKKVQVKTIIKEENINLPLILGDYEGIIISEINCSNDYQNKVLWYLSDFGFDKEVLGLNSNLGINYYITEQYKPLGSCRINTKAILKENYYQFHPTQKYNIVIDLSKKMCNRLKEKEEIKGNLNKEKELSYLDIIKEIVKLMGKLNSLNKLYVYNGDLESINLENLNEINCVNNNLEIDSNKFPTNENFIILSDENKIIKINTDPFYNINYTITSLNFANIESIKNNLMYLLNGKEINEWKILKDFKYKNGEFDYITYELNINKAKLKEVNGNYVLENNENLTVTIN